MKSDIEESSNNRPTLGNVEPEGGANRRPKAQIQNVDF
jgi:hypothetical protein